MIDRIDSLISRCESWPLSVRQRELDFLDSIKKQFDRKGSLSPGQQSWFGSLEVKYSEEALANHLLWELNFSQEQRKIAIRIAHYYRENPPYFDHQVQKIFSDPTGFILSKREWDKFCENKYALKIRKEYEQELKFSVGDSVQIRATNKLREANYNRNTGQSMPFSQSRTKDRVGFIIKTDAKNVTKARKGARVYQVLLVGDSSPIYAHESDLKRAKKA